MYQPENQYDFSLPIGSIIIYSGQIYDNKNGELVLKESIRLAGMCEADGTLLKKDLYPVLYNIIGNNYSYENDSDDSFRVPDLRGLFIRGVQNIARDNPKCSMFDDKDSLTGDRLNYSTLKKVPCDKGAELVGTLQQEEFKKHSHNMKDLTQIIGGTESPTGQVFGPTSPMSKYTEPSDERGVETRPNNIALYFLIKIEKSHWKAI